MVFMSSGGVKSFASSRTEMICATSCFREASSWFVRPGSSRPPQGGIEKVEAADWTWYCFSALKYTRPDTVLTSYPQGDEQKYGSICVKPVLS